MVTRSRRRHVCDGRTDQGGYNHLFVFTYNSPTTVPVCEADEQDNLGCVNDGRPVPVRICDRLTFVGGSVSEFYGFTEMSFPVWDTQVWKESDGPCPMPAPRALMAADFRGKALEGSEAGLVTVTTSFCNSRTTSWIAISTRTALLISVITTRTNAAMNAAAGTVRQDLLCVEF